MSAQSLRHQLLSATEPGRVDFLFDYLRVHGNKHYEEEVAQMQHALQCAALATRDRESATLVAAALFHDIGHMLAGDPVEANNPTLKDDLHEELGANYLKGVFPEAVLQPIQLHVAAKRYLCTLKPAYYEQLSEASQKSFRLQGGPMSEQEIAAFEQHPFHEAAVKLRGWDDQAKDVNVEHLEIDAFRDSVLEALS
ncbi:HD domain-containing protein [Phaeodactylibacter xiamenensis]|uniref:HD domain-containing protein n=1 Tax=Phaeodactylibacter xiamenensis TaxID=1524460 RepID=UPI0024A8BC76|nr:HD domain-containing protein [Phaeodactylibacter xiamenensis]